AKPDEAKPLISLTPTDEQVVQPDGPRIPLGTALGVLLNADRLGGHEDFTFAARDNLALLLNRKRCHVRSRRHGNRATLIREHKSEVISALLAPSCKVTIVEIPREAGHFKRTFAHLQLKPPAMVDVARWRQCVEDGKRFLAAWGEQAEALGWDARDLFGL